MCESYANLSSIRKSYKFDIQDILANLCTNFDRSGVSIKITGKLVYNPSNYFNSKIKFRKQ